MRMLSKLGLSLGAVLLLVVTQTAGAKTPSVLVKQTNSPIATLALDGPRVAYASGSRVHVWNTLTGATTLMKGNYSSHTAEIAAGD